MPEFCGQCGSSLKAGLRFCDQCGTPVPSGPQAPTAAPQAPAGRRMFRAIGAGVLLLGVGALALYLFLPPPSATDMSNLAAGYNHTCALDDKGVTCWGNNGDGRTTIPAGLVNPRAVAAGDYHTCTLDDNGITCWGSYKDGQRTVPAGLVNPRAVATGHRHTCALDDNGVTCWGDNDEGQTTVPADLRNR